MVGGTANGHHDLQTGSCTGGEVRGRVGRSFAGSAASGFIMVFPSTRRSRMLPCCLVVVGRQLTAVQQTPAQTVTDSADCHLCWRYCSSPPAYSHTHPPAQQPLPIPPPHTSPTKPTLVLGLRCLSSAMAALTTEPSLLKSSPVPVRLVPLE